MALSLLAGLATVAGSAAASSPPVATSRPAEIRVSALGTLAGPHRLRVVGSGFSPEAAVVVAQCSSAAVKAALKSVSSALDDCDERFVGVTSSGAQGSFTVKARADPTIRTALGTVDCRRTSCLLGAVNLSALHGAPLQVAILPLSFSRSAADPPAPRPANRLVSDAYPTAPLSPSEPWRATIVAYPAGSLGPARIGQLTSVPARPLPHRAIAGEGLLTLTMSAPQTSWSDPLNTSVVVQARVDHGPWQQIVLFSGAKPFSYEGFTGPLRSGPHVVQVRVRRDLSRVKGHPPLVLLVHRSLRVVSPRVGAGFELAHAPVLYERRVSNTEDTPLITYASDVAQSGGARRLTYVVTWSHEDAGTGFVPWLEWGTWGRMTDIETAISFSVDRRGRVSRSTYLTCVTCGRHFPENRTALDETEAPFRGRWFGGHPILRVATGNNDFSDYVPAHPTAMRFQQALAAPPLPGDTREGAMDRNPWTYAVMGQELARNRADYSTSAASAGPGDPRQYLIVQLDTTAKAVAAVGVDIRLAGSSHVYSNDLGTSYPLYDGGLGRTVVKVPLGQVSRPITLVSLRMAASRSGEPSLVVHRLRVLQYVHGMIVVRHTPAPVAAIEPAAPPASGAPPTITAAP
ncbi:MAG: hypothetical protein ACR2NR_18785 [Solirubrobacteraceae bacterium]